MQPGKLFVISGPSGVGKSRLCEALVQGGGFRLSVSMTTRKPRAGETDGVSYFFVSDEAFDRAVLRGDLLEYARVYDHRYGTPKKAVFDQLLAGHDVLLEIEMQGAMQVRAAAPEAVLIYILPPSLQALRERLIGRGTEDAVQLQKRSEEALGEIRLIQSYDYCVVNEDFEQALCELRAIASAEHCRVAGRAGEIIHRYEEEQACFYTRP